MMMMTKTDNNKDDYVRCKQRQRGRWRGIWQRQLRIRQKLKQRGLPKESIEEEGENVSQHSEHTDILKNTT